MIVCIYIYIGKQTVFCLKSSMCCGKNITNQWIYDRVTHADLRIARDFSWTQEDRFRSPKSTINGE